MKSTVCVVCGKEHDACVCTVSELRDRVEGLATILVGLAGLIRDCSPAMYSVANSILKQYAQDQEEIKEEYDFSNAKRGPIESPKEEE